MSTTTVKTGRPKYRGCVEEQLGYSYGDTIRCRRCSRLLPARTETGRCRFRSDGLCYDCVEDTKRNVRTMQRIEAYVVWKPHAVEHVDARDRVDWARYRTALAVGDIGGTLVEMWSQLQFGGVSIKVIFERAEWPTRNELMAACAKRAAT